MSIEFTGELLLERAREVVISKTAPLGLLLPEVADFPRVDFRFFTLYSAGTDPLGHTEIFGPYGDESYLRITLDSQTNQLSIQKIPPLDFPSAPITRALEEREAVSLQIYLRRLVTLNQWPMSDADRELVRRMLGVLETQAT